MIRLFNLLACCLLVFTLRAQESDADPLSTNQDLQMNRFLANTNSRLLYSFSTTYKGIDGSPYFTESPLVGTITTKSGAAFREVRFKYNVYEDVLEYDKGGEKINLFSKEIAFFEFNDPKTGVKRRFLNGFDPHIKDLNEESFFEIVHHQGQTQVLRRLEKEVIRVTANPQVPGMNSNTSNDAFSEVKEEAYLIKDGRFVEVKLKRGSFLKAFEDQQKRVKTYIKKNLLPCRSVEDLVEVTKYYDGLVERRAERYNQEKE